MNSSRHDSTPKVILDIRGSLIQMLNRGSDPDAILDVDNKKINTAEFGLQNWLNEYLSHILEDHAPRQLIAVWDGGNTYRKSFYPVYKALRKDFSELQTKQITKLESLAKALLASLGAVQVQLPDQEADDVIAFLCERIPEDICLYTGDKDLLQLASDKVLCFYRGNAVDAFEVDGYKYPVSLVRVYKSIVGDSSDNYPGVEGVGPKGFDELVQEFGVDGMLELEQCVATGNFKPLEEAIAETKNKKLKKLFDQRFADKSTDTVGWQVCYRLACLAPWLCEKRFAGNLPKLLWYKRIPHKENALHICRSAGVEAFFNEHLARFFGLVTLITADNVVVLKSLIETDAFNSGPVCGFDLEGYDTLHHPPFKEAKKSGYVDVLSQAITGASFCYGDNLQHTVYVSVDHKDTNNVSKYVLADAVVSMRNPVVHNASYEIQVLKQDLGVHLDSPIDTLPMISQVDENLELNLKDNSQTFLAHRQMTYQELLDKCMADWEGEVPVNFGMNHITAEQVLQYGPDDAICAAHLWSLLDLVLSLEQTREFTYNNYFAAAHPLNEAFEQGENIDLAELARLAEEDAETISSARTRIAELLAEHCTTPNLTAANTLVAEDYEYLTAKWRENREMTQDDINFRCKKEIEECTAASVYRPYAVKKKEPNFIPTVGQLDKVREVLGFVNPITKATKSYLSDWIATNPPVSISHDQHVFCQLLAGNLDRLKERTGPEYETFVSACNRWLLPTMPDIAEGDELNFGSPNQVSDLLYLKLALPVRKRGKVLPNSFRAKHRLEGGPSTDEKAMKLAIADDTEPGDWKREVLENLLKAKAAITRGSYYYMPYPVWVHPKDGRIHGGLKFPSTHTRRPTASQPNFLQVTKKDGGKVRNCFLPAKKDEVIVAIDFSQQELRILANESRDPFLVNAYLSDPPMDVHAVTASMICYDYLRINKPDVLAKLGLNPGMVIYESFMTFLKHDDEEISSPFKMARTIAKTINFLIIYGGGAQGLAMQLSIKTDAAKVYMQTVLSQLVGFRKWQEEMLEFGRTYGYVLMAYGSRYHVGNKLVAKDDGYRARAERQAINAIIQGGAAEILAEVMGQVHKLGILRDTGAKSIIPIYDEIKASVPASAAFEYVTRMQDVMNLTPPGGIVPMVAEVSVAPMGKGWGSMIELKSRPTEEQVMEVIHGKRQEAA